MNRLTIGEKTAQVSHAGSVNSTMKTLASAAPSTAEWGRTKVDAYSCAMKPSCSARRPLNHDAAKRETDHHGDTGYGEDQTFHLGALLWSAIKMPASVVKAISESAGIESRPNRLMYSSVHDTPLAQGWRLSGTTPA